MFVFNHDTVSLTESRKHLALVLDSRSDFKKHRQIILYKSFIGPHLDYGDIIYDQVYNASFHRKIESIQTNAAIVITGAV